MNLNSWRQVWAAPQSTRSAKTNYQFDDRLKLEHLKECIKDFGKNNRLNIYKYSYQLLADDEYIHSFSQIKDFDTKYAFSANILMYPTDARRLAFVLCFTLTPRSNPHWYMSSYVKGKSGKLLKDLNNEGWYFGDMITKHIW